MRQFYTAEIRVSLCCSYVLVSSRTDNSCRRVCIRVVANTAAPTAVMAAVRARRAERNNKKMLNNPPTGTKQGLHKLFR